MSETVIVLTFCLCASGGRAPGDRWFGPDKVRHFVTAAVVQSMTYSGLRVARVKSDNALVGASVVTLALSVGKEEHDRRARGEFSARDLVWDVAGAGAASLLLTKTRR